MVSDHRRFIFLSFISIIYLSVSGNIKIFEQKNTFFVEHFKKIQCIIPITMSHEKKHNDQSNINMNQQLHRSFNEYRGPLTLMQRYEIASASYRFSNIHRSYEGGKTGQSSALTLIEF